MPDGKRRPPKPLFEQASASPARPGSVTVSDPGQGEHVAALLLSRKPVRGDGSAASYPGADEVATPLRPERLAAVGSRARWLSMPP